MSIVVVATIRPLAGHHEEVRSAYEEVVGRVHEADEGCELYALHDGEDRIVLIEKWASAEALQRHSTGPTMSAMRPKIADKVEGKPEVMILDAVPAGDSVLGAL